MSEPLIPLVIREPNSILNCTKLANYDFHCPFAGALKQRHQKYSLGPCMRILHRVYVGAFFFILINSSVKCYPFGQNSIGYRLTL